MSRMHLDRFDVLRQAVRRAAFFKINALSLRLNGHFEYASAPALARSVRACRRLSFRN